MLKQHIYTKYLTSQLRFLYNKYLSLDFIAIGWNNITHTPMHMSTAAVTILTLSLRNSFFSDKTFHQEESVPLIAIWSTTLFNVEINNIVEQWDPGVECSLYYVHIPLYQCYLKEITSYDQQARKIVP